MKQFQGLKVGGLQFHGAYKIQLQINKLYCAYIYFFLGYSHLLPVFEAEWKDKNGLSVFVKCVEGKINVHYLYNILSAQKVMRYTVFGFSEEDAGKKPCNLSVHFPKPETYANLNLMQKGNFYH